MEKQKFDKDYSDKKKEVFVNCTKKNYRLTKDEETKVKDLSKMREQERTCCYECRLEFAAIDRYETGIGIGRINKPEEFG